MGTHPIFESDFDCLTDVQVGLKSKKMSTHLQWAIINKFSAFDIKRAGTTWTKEHGHLKGKKSLKYNTLVNPNGLTVSNNSEGGVVFTAGKSSMVLKRNARKTFKSIRNTTNKGKLRKDQKRAAVKKAAALLRAQQKASK